MDENREIEQRRRKREERRKRQLLKEKISLVGGTALIVVLIILSLILKGCDKGEKQEEQSVSLDFEVVEDPTRVTLVAAGDNLYHKPLVETGQNDSGVWNYDGVYENVKKVI